MSARLTSCSRLRLPDALEVFEMNPRLPLLREDVCGSCAETLFDRLMEPRIPRLWSQTHRQRAVSAASDLLAQLLFVGGEDFNALPAARDRHVPLLLIGCS